MKLVYSVEETPIGTGGGIKLALEKCKGNKAFLLNGDTFFDVNLKRLIESDVADNDVVLSLKKMFTFDRYGTVETDIQNRIVAFADKKYCDEGLISGGVYLVRTDILNEFV